VTASEIRSDDIFLENKKELETLLITIQCYYKTYMLSITKNNICYYLKLRYPFPTEQRNPVKRNKNTYIKGIAK